MIVVQDIPNVNRLVCAPRNKVGDIVNIIDTKVNSHLNGFYGHLTGHQRLADDEVMLWVPVFKHTTNGKTYGFITMVNWSGCMRRG